MNADLTVADMLAIRHSMMVLHIAAIEADHYELAMASGESAMRIGEEIIAADSKMRGERA